MPLSVGRRTIVAIFFCTACQYSLCFSLSTSTPSNSFTMSLPCERFWTMNELVGIVVHYVRSIEYRYDHRASLCSLLRRNRLVRQVISHSALSMTSFFARESYLSSVIELCHGTRNVMQRFVDWYDIDQAILPPSSTEVSSVFSRELIFDRKYVDLSCKNLKILFFSFWF